MTLSRIAVIRRLSRMAPLLCLIALVVVGCSPDHYPQTALRPISDFGRIGDDIQTTTFKWAVVVFILVEGALLYAIFRFRGKPGDPEPAQIHGNTTVEIIWTIIPALILAAIAVPTVRGIFQTNCHPDRRCARGPGYRASMVVGVPLPHPQRYDGERAAHSGGTDDLAQDGDGGRGPQLLESPVRRQARRLSEPGDPTVVQGRRGRRVSGAMRRVLRHPARENGVPGPGAVGGGVPGLGRAHADAEGPAARAAAPGESAAPGRSRSRARRRLPRPLRRRRAPERSCS